MGGVSVRWLIVHLQHLAAGVRLLEVGIAWKRQINKIDGNKIQFKLVTKTNARANVYKCP